MIALETASQDALYKWREETNPEPFQREQVFPGRTYESVSGPEMERAVLDTLDRLNPDVVATISYATPDARAALQWCRRHQRGAVMISEARAVDAKRHRLREGIKRHLVRAADAAFVSGTAHAAYLACLGMPQTKMFMPASVVDNAYFWEHAEAAREKPPLALPGLDDPTPFFLSSGRFIVRKDLPTLLRAYAAYRESVSTPWRLVLLGDGPLRPEVEHLAGAGVTLAGFRQIEDLPAYYGLASAYVHPARADQWGLVVNEAMATGLPVIVSRGAGCALDLVREGENGWTFPSGDVGALTEALRRMSDASTNHATLGERSREIIAAYTPETFAAGLWNAATLAQQNANRPFPLRSRALFAALRIAARSTSSFHTVEA